MQVDLNPAGSASDILAMVLCTPTLHKAHPDSAHFCQLVDYLKAMADRLGEKLSKQLVVEDLEAAATWDFTDCGGMKAVLVVAVAALHKNAAVAQAFRIHLPTNIIQMDAFPNVSSGVFNSRVPIDIRQEPETKPICLV